MFAFNFLNDLTSIGLTFREKYSQFNIEYVRLQSFLRYAVTATKTQKMSIFRSNFDSGIACSTSVISCSPHTIDLNFSVNVRYNLNNSKNMLTRSRRNSHDAAPLLVKESPFSVFFCHFAVTSSRGSECNS